ncbi:Transcriptional regulator, HxlR family [Pediococcus damnosus]|uniref:Transcriptional regulator, HxlR family n=1 Tax=Pediococcus damnosus TaxID=51663 RepID=A0A0R2HJU8_9LACO|nr:helix-turn-helix domain-containing protein [Pediococcus damnosus]AMV61374.1 Transcriptional regulator, HxlR family [Pediococcus damnosus]AMV62270.1 Transcriptional regulator, HxlR family [Pediococcus damnosus]AMV65733.1 Transcriptional regulator, HxlR family [Pediococcus damnosus]AMV67871.1 Transcriptional regulator, HxlR family [Pediococcus damnosus]AMV70075.1 Transcriptional regulator, HxlR family [Pediococcus damnosus]
MSEALETRSTIDDFSLCPKFSRTFSVLGQKWNGLIIEVLLNEDSQRFKDLAHNVPKCSDRVLVERLKSLEAEGIVDRVTHKNSSLIEYQLTEKGEALRPVMSAVHKFADCWYANED